MKHKVSELEGALLDYWVAKALGRWDSAREFRFISGGVLVCPAIGGDDNGEEFRPSTEWAHGGPIIERERIAPQPQRRGDIGNEWADRPEPSLGWEVQAAGRTITGPTYLIAAMRAVVASKFGEEVALP